MARRFRAPPQPSKDDRVGATLGAASATGALAGLATLAGLALAARAEGAPALRPAQASARQALGDGPPGAARSREVEPTTVALGAAINVGASMFWALPYVWWLRRRPRGAVETVGGAAATAALAAAVDYGMLPRRFTPGWERDLSPRGVATGFAALALGLAAGGLLLRRPAGRPPRRESGKRADDGRGA